MQLSINTIFIAIETNFRIHIHMTCTIYITDRSNGFKPILALGESKNASYITAKSVQIIFLAHKVCGISAVALISRCSCDNLISALSFSQQYNSTLVGSTFVRHISFVLTNTVKQCFCEMLIFQFSNKQVEDVCRILFGRCFFQSNCGAFVHFTLKTSVQTFFIPCSISHQLC